MEMMSPKTPVPPSYGGGAVRRSVRLLVWAAAALPVWGRSVEEDRLWRSAEKFTCRCFCRAATYTVDEEAVAHMKSVQFGLMAEPIPLHEAGDFPEVIKPLLSEVRIQHGESRVTKIHDFQSAGIVYAPPLLSFAEREKLLNELSGGAYAVAKAKFELTGGKEHARVMDDLQKKLGVRLHSDSGREEHRTAADLVVREDKSRYKSLAARKLAWGKVCAEMCVSVAQQEARWFHYKEHTEFRFLKPREDPMSRGRVFSDEAPQAAIAGFLPVSPSAGKALAAWVKRNTDKYLPLLQALQVGGRGLVFPHCSELHAQFHARHRRRTRVTWGSLLKRLQVARDPAEVYPPTKDVSLEAVVGEDERVGIVGVRARGARVSVPKTRVARLRPREQPNMHAEEAVQRLLAAGRSNMVHWPKGVDIAVADRITPVFRFTLFVQLRGKGYREPEIPHGVPSEPIATEGIDANGDPVEAHNFLGLVLSDEEFASIHDAVNSIIIEHWVPPILERYRKKGLDLFYEFSGRDEGGDDDDDGDGEDGMASASAAASGAAAGGAGAGGVAAAAAGSKQAKRGVGEISLLQLSLARSKSRSGKSGSSRRSGSASSRSRGSASGSASGSAVSAGSAGSGSGSSDSDDGDGSGGASDIYARDFFNGAPTGGRDKPRGVMEDLAKAAPIEFMKFTFVGGFELACWHEAQDAEPEEGAAAGVVRAVVVPQNSVGFFMRPEKVELMRVDGVRAELPVKTPTMLVTTLDGAGVDRMRSPVAPAFLETLGSHCRNTDKVWYQLLFDTFAAATPASNALNAGEDDGLFFRNTCDLDAADLGVRLITGGAPGTTRYYVNADPAVRTMTEVQLGGPRLATRAVERAAKCFNRLFPGAVVAKRVRTTRGMEERAFRCVNVPLRGRYVLQEEGPTRRRGRR